ncbi:hypothetical protein V9L05_12615 [Bernardetia sp. Wsw4-3y2]|uniref:hypothetical protein n=1 Tax=Bernardetia sp. Wsw4-3y2 TaxID=3127471 RepID=UPI0030D39544
MKALHTSKYYEISFDKSKSLIMHKALPATLDMSDEDFKQEMLLFAEMCETYTPTRDLVNLVNMKYSIAPKMQEWVNTEVFPKFMNIIDRMALVMPSGIFEVVALKQTMEEEIAQNFYQKYFDNEEQALEWVME